MPQAAEQPSVGQQWIDLYEKRGGNPYAQPNVTRPYFTRFMRGPFIQHIVRYAKLPPGATTIEVGCGSARFTACLALMGFRVTALDVSPTMLENALDMKRQAEALFGRVLEVTTQIGNLEERLPIADESFDLVFNEGVVEHWLDDSQRAHVLGEMARITKRGGVMAIIVPNGGHPWIDYWEKHNLATINAPPMTHYSTAKLQRELAAVGMRDVAVDGINPWHTIDWGTTSRLRFLIGGILNKAVPLPRSARERWGIMVFGAGRKP